MSSIPLSHILTPPNLIGIDITYLLLFVVVLVVFYDLGFFLFRLKRPGFCGVFLNLAGLGFLVLIRDVGCLDDFCFCAALMLFRDLGCLLFCYKWPGILWVFFFFFT